MRKHNGIRRKSAGDDNDAIRRHNRNAGIISMCVGWVVLCLFAEGLLRLIGVIPPLLPWLQIKL